MGWAFIFEFYPERKRGVISKNIKAQPMCKFAQLYACHELFRELYTHGIWWLFHLPPSEILNWFWIICIWTRYFKTKIWMLTWKTYLLCIFQPSIDFDFCNISSSCDVVYKGRWLTQAGYWFIFDFVSILLVWVAKFKMPSNWKISVT